MGSPLRTALRRPSPPLTSSAPERESLRPRLPAARSQLTCRRPRWWSRRPSTRSTSAHPPWRSPPPLPLPPGTSVLALLLAQCLEGWLCCQGGLHLQGVQHGQGWFHGQGFLLSPLLDPTPPAIF